MEVKRYVSLIRDFISSLLSYKVAGILTSQKDRTDEAEPRKMSVNCLSLDYDGTISPVNVSRMESRVPLETRVMLRQVSRFLPIAIVTMKDLPFVIPRTPFAHVWSAIGGLEMRIGKRVLKRECLERKLPSVSQALKYAESHIKEAGIEVEEKQDSEGNTVAFCVDWRQAGNAKSAKREVELVAAYCKALDLELIRYESQPFYDVYPGHVDKGLAVKDVLRELGLKSGVMYIGDSNTDNPAFKVSDVSLGIVHKETPLKSLECDYFVRFEDVAYFFNSLLTNRFLFSSDFPMVTINPRKMRDH